MKVVMYENVDKIGARGEIKEVSDGYARNYLFPSKLAALATQKNILDAQKRIQRMQLQEVKEAETAKEIAEKIEKLSLNIVTQIGEGGKLYGSVTAADIAKALAEEGYEIDKRKILMDEPIKEEGLFQVKVKLHHDVTAEVKVWVMEHKQKNE